MNLQHVNTPQNRLSPTWHEQFLSTLLPRVRIHARFRFRDLPEVEREEAESEAIAVAFIFFARLVERGRNPSAFALRIARIAVLRVKSGRLAGCSDRSGDVLSRLARQQRKFQVESLDSTRIQTRNGWREIIVEDHKSTPAETAASRIDVGEWLNGMTNRRRQIAEMLASGHSTMETAEQFQITPGRVSQLRREFESSWHEFQRDTHDSQSAAA
jgi:hypothetical protein